MKLYDCKATLDDQQVLDFCRNGFMAFHSVVPDEINKLTREYMDQHADNPEPVGILHQDWFDESVIKNPHSAGAVRSLLGRDFELPIVISNHRTVGPTLAQNFHSDEGSIISHELNYLQVFYYPGGATKDMGPTEIVPGSHLAHGRYPMQGRLKSLKNSKLLTSPPGSIFITAYPILHRRSKSTFDGIRDNLKFNYWRTTKPTRDWDFDPNFKFSWLPHSRGPLFGPEQAKMLVWLSGEEWKHIGGQSWPASSGNRHEHDQMGLPSSFSRDS